jgi:hypothetical protein
LLEGTSVPIIRLRTVEQSSLVVMAAFEKLLPRLLKEQLPPDCHLYYDKSQPVLNQSKLDLAITTVTHRSSKSWATFPFSLWFETNAKVKVLCVNVNCKFKEEREWHGRIVGKGIHGSVNALLATLKHNNKTSQGRTPFMGLLTICDGCCGQLDFRLKAHMDRIINSTSGSLVLGLSDKEVDEVTSSKVIIMEGMLMNAITTISIDGQWREWPLLRPFFIN